MNLHHARARALPRALFVVAIGLSIALGSSARASDVSSAPGGSAFDQNRIDLWPPSYADYHGSFIPAGLIVAEGTTVYWYNGTGSTQVLQSAPLFARSFLPLVSVGAPAQAPVHAGAKSLASSKSIADALFPPESLPPGGSFGYTFGQSGTYRFTLQGYPDTLGTIVVEAPLPPARYQIVDLGAVGSQPDAPIAINNRGQVVAASRAIPLPDGTTGYGIDINNNGTILGTDGTDYFVLTASGILTRISSQALDSASGLNDAGQVAGRANGRAAIWQNGVVTYADPNTQQQGYPYDIGNGGQVVGQSYYGYPYIWQAGAARNLGSLGGCGGIANGINSAGLVVGYADVPDVWGKCAGAAVPFLWQNGQLLDITGNRNCAIANAINDANQIVGACNNFAFIWQDGQLTDLNSLIPANSGWTLISANDINLSGQIVGWGGRNGSTHVFLLTPTS